MPPHVRRPRVALLLATACFGYACVASIWSIEGHVVGGFLAFGLTVVLVVVATLLLFDGAVHRPSPDEPIEAYVRIIGDGSRRGSLVVEAASGRPVLHVQDVVIVMGGRCHPPRAALLIQPPGADEPCRRVVVAVVGMELGAGVLPVVRP